MNANFSCPNEHTKAANPGKTFCPRCGAILKEGRDAVPPDKGSPSGIPSPKAGRPAHFPTMLEGSPALAQQPDRPLVEPPPRNIKTARVPRDSAPLGASAPSPSQDQSQEHILAVLVTHTWKPGGELLPIRGERNRVGSGDRCEVILLNDASLSDHHLTIEIRLTGSKTFRIFDAGSKNGTFLNGKVVEEKEILKNFDRIRAGATEFLFVIVNPDLVGG